LLPGGDGLGSFSLSLSDHILSSRDWFTKVIKSFISSIDGILSNIGGFINYVGGCINKIAELGLSGAN